MYPAQGYMSPVPPGGGVRHLPAFDLPLQFASERTLIALPTPTTAESLMTTTAHLLTTTDLRDLIQPQRAASGDTSTRLPNAQPSATTGLLGRCVGSLALDDLIELASERDGHTPEAIMGAMVGLLNGLEMRCQGDFAALAAIATLRDWHLADLRELLAA